MFSGQTLLVTGGTGSFGHDFTRLVLGQHDPMRVIVYSRDEKKQHGMRLEFNDPRCHSSRQDCLGGDIDGSMAIELA
jgi:FlaA1/EpsC-like NDP-sugar epimerase